MRWRTAAAFSSLESLFQALSATRSLPQIAQLHQQLLVRGLAPAPFRATKLLQLYADASDLPSALRLFAALPRPSVFAWTPILALFSRSGDHLRCLAGYAAMRYAAVAPDGYVFPSVLRSSVAAAHPSAVHADAVKFRSDAVLPVRNALVDAYSKVGDTASARCVFDLTDGRDLVSWNSMICGYVNAGCIGLARELLRSMESDGCEPDLVTWNIVMDGYSRAGRSDEALKIFDQISDPNVVSWTTLISCYSRCGNHEAALAIFRRMLSAATIPPDQDTLSCVISCCRNVARLANGREVHAYGLKTMAADAFYSSAGAALVTMYASCNKLSTAEQAFLMMDPADVVAWNAVILGFAHSGLDHTALEYFRDLQSRGNRSDETTVATILPVCDLNLGKQIHAHVARHHTGSSPLVWNALMNMYARSGCIRDAYLVFSRMVSRDVVSWNTMIGAYGSHGLGKEALELMDLMKGLGPKPNAITFTNALMACSHCGMVDEGLELFENLSQSWGLVPTMEQYACVVDLLARAGRFGEAAGFIRRMAVRPSKSVWGALLAACRTHQNVEFGRLAFEQLVLLEPENPGNYVTMSNIYARAGQWEDAKKVRRMMERRALVKPSGYSWIEAT
ncbi:pentatricopeptide repeat-containing protein DOT4, chloroplastic-like [Elaeis guineensis]|uniref:Pentatricopeptide repeat-containing protein DOT4, chloroplastic n=1 Tax=Elaeis guineensis var. tenera TaxID=51953 RepID=A0A6I9RHK4_ELAGV|nr:pentatricopeptide repeat-containing protein DOT4, chloroplastic [Elaeis guineensis]